MPLIASDDLLILTTRALCLQANYDVKTVAGKAFVMDALSLIARESCSIFMPTGQFLKDKNAPKGNQEGWRRVADQLARNCGGVIDLTNLKQRIWLGGKTKGVKSVVFRSLMQEYKPSFDSTHPKGASGTTESPTDVEVKIGELLELLASARTTELAQEEERNEIAARRAQAEGETADAFNGHEGRRAAGAKKTANKPAGARGDTPAPPPSGCPSGDPERPSGHPSGAREPSSEKQKARTWGSLGSTTKFTKSTALTALGMNVKTQKAWIIIDDFEERFFKLHGPPDKAPETMRRKFDEEDMGYWQGYAAKLKVGSAHGAVEYEWRKVHRNDDEYLEWVTAVGAPFLLMMEEGQEGGEEDPDEPFRAEKNGLEQATITYREWYDGATAPQRSRAAAYVETLNPAGLVHVNLEHAESEVSMMMNGMKEMGSATVGAFSAMLADNKLGRKEDRDAKVEAAAETVKANVIAAAASAAVRVEERAHELELARISAGTKSTSSSGPPPPSLNATRWSSISHMLDGLSLQQYGDLFDAEGIDDIQEIVATLQRDLSGAALVALLKAPPIQMKSGHANKLVNSFFNCNN